MTWRIGQQIKITGVASLIMGTALILTSGVIAQSGATLDVPEQIGQPDRADIVVEDIRLPDAPAMSPIIVDSIATTTDSQPTIVMQSEGGRDICGPEVSEWGRRQAGVDCSKLSERVKPRMLPLIEEKRDPLISTDKGDAREALENLGLGADVPATIILQQ